MAMEWNPTTGRSMMTTAAAGTAPQPEPAPTMLRSAVMPPDYTRYTQKQPMIMDANMQANYDQLHQAKLADMAHRTSSLAPVQGMEGMPSRDIGYGISPIEMGGDGAGRYITQDQIDMQANMQSQMEALKAAQAQQPRPEMYQTAALGSVAQPAVMPPSSEPRQFQTMIGTPETAAKYPQQQLQTQYQNMASHAGSGLQDQQRLAMEAMSSARQGPGSTHLNDTAEALNQQAQANNATAAPQGPSTQPPAPQGNAFGKGGTQPQAQPQGNAYGKGGMQQANPATQALSGAANLMGGTSGPTNGNVNAVNDRMAGAMGSQAQAQAPAPQSNGKGGAMGGSPQMGGYTPPNNFSRPAPQQGGGKGGQMQQPAPPPSYSGGGKGGGGYRPTYQRPQRPMYGGKGG